MARLRRELNEERGLQAQLETELTEKRRALNEALESLGISEERRVEDARKADPRRKEEVRAAENLKGKSEEEARRIAEAQRIKAASNEGKREEIRRRRSRLLNLMVN